MDVQAVKQVSSQAERPDNTTRHPEEERLRAQYQHVLSPQAQPPIQSRYPLIISSQFSSLVQHTHTHIHLAYRKWLHNVLVHRKWAKPVSLVAMTTTPTSHTQ